MEEKGQKGREYFVFLEENKCSETLMDHPDSLSLFLFLSNQNQTGKQRPMSLRMMLDFRVDLEDFE